MRAHRVTFAIAAAYNLAFGAWAVLAPDAFFDLFRLARPNYPSVWACLGMVVGVYALAYAWIARHPGRGDVIAAVGLIGKVLGPAGWMLAVWRDELPARTFPLVLFNDLVWWFPFLAYLLRDEPNRRRVVAWTCVAFNLAASVGLLLVRPGTEAAPDLFDRAEWVNLHAPLWAAVWFLWVGASMSLVAFCASWGGMLVDLGARASLVRLAVLLVAAGVLFDLAGETLNVAWLTEPLRTVDEFGWGAGAAMFLSAGVGNGLYCAGGIGLSVMSWKTGLARRRLGLLGFAMWLVGLVLSFSVFAGHRPGIVFAGGALMALFLPFALILGWRMRAAAPLARPPSP